MDKPKPVKERNSKPRADHRRDTPGSKSRSRRDFLKSSTILASAAVSGPLSLQSRMHAAVSATEAAATPATRARKSRRDI